jgi:hypothetical protein
MPPVDTINRLLHSLGWSSVALESARLSYLHVLELNRDNFSAWLGLAICEASANFDFLFSEENLERITAWQIFEGYNYWIPTAEIEEALERFADAGVGNDTLSELERTHRLAMNERGAADRHIKHHYWRDSRIGPNQVKLVRHIDCPRRSPRWAAPRSCSRHPDHNRQRSTPSPSRPGGRCSPFG